MTNNLQKEIWKDIVGYEGLYKVSNFGRVKSVEKFVKCRDVYITKKEIILKPRIYKGYAHAMLYKNGKAKQFQVHRLVALAFIPNPENKPQVNHIDGNPLNNHISNIEWNTPKENIVHAELNGLRHHPKGEASINSKLCEWDIKIIFKLYNNTTYWHSQDKLGELFGVNQSCIWKILNKKRWQYLNLKKADRIVEQVCPKGENHPLSKLDNWDVIIMKKLNKYTTYWKNKQRLAELFCINESCVCKIISGKRWGHIEI